MGREALRVFTWFKNTVRFPREEQNRRQRQTAQDGDERAREKGGKSKEERDGESQVVAERQSETGVAQVLHGNLVSRVCVIDRRVSASTRSVALRAQSRVAS